MLLRTSWQAGGRGTQSQREPGVLWKDPTASVSPVSLPSFTKAPFLTRDSNMLLALSLDLLRGLHSQGHQRKTPCWFSSDSSPHKGLRGAARPSGRGLGTEAVQRQRQTHWGHRAPGGGGVAVACRHLNTVHAAASVAVSLWGRVPSRDGIFSYRADAPPCGWGRPAQPRGRDYWRPEGPRFRGGWVKWGRRMAREVGCRSFLGARPTVGTGRVPLGPGHKLRPP